jgi:hypothetical protein
MRCDRPRARENRTLANVSQNKMLCSKMADLRIHVQIVLDDLNFELSAANTCLQGITGVLVSQVEWFVHGRAHFCGGSGLVICRGLQQEGWSGE